MSGGASSHTSLGVPSSSCREMRRSRVSAGPWSPCTTTIRGLASEVLLEPGVDPVPLRSAAKLDSLENVSASSLVERLGRLSDDRMRQVCDALEVAVGCE